MEVTSNSNLELPKLVLCFCQKLSGLIISATWMQQGKDSCRIFSRGLMESHLDPRMSTITVNPRLQTSSLEKKKKTGLNHASPSLVRVPPGEADSASFFLMSPGLCLSGGGGVGGGEGISHLLCIKWSHTLSRNYYSKGPWWALMGTDP